MASDQSRAASSCHRAADRHATHAAVERQQIPIGVQRSCERLGIEDLIRLSSSQQQQVGIHARPEKRIVRVSYADIEVRQTGAVLNDVCEAFSAFVVQHRVLVRRNSA